MIKKILISVIFLFTFHFLFGQYVFMKKCTGIDIGGGFRTLGIDAAGATFNIEHGVYFKRKIGTFAVGLHANVIFPKNSDLESSVALRGIYHIGLFRTDIVDLYTGIGIVREFDNPLQFFYPDTFVGARFKFDKHSKFAVFTEAALYGTNLNAGLSMILK